MYRHNEVATFWRPRCLLGDGQHRGQIASQLDPELALLRSQDNRINEPAEHLRRLQTGVLALERDLEAHLVRDLASIEQGLVFVDRQVSNDIGRVDVLARDRDGTTVILELKVGEATDASIGQIARYLGWYARQGKLRDI